LPKMRLHRHNSITSGLPVRTKPLARRMDGGGVTRGERRG
jgi:hypothetical protein